LRVIRLPPLTQAPSCTRIASACPVLLSAGILLFYVVQMRHLLKTQHQVDVLAQTITTAPSSECVVLNDDDHTTASPLVRRAIAHPDGVATDTLQGGGRIAVCDATRTVCCTAP
jgi:hypothetical protein